MCSNIDNEAEPAIAVLSEHISSSSSDIVNMAAVLGLGIAYAGTAKEQVLDVLMNNVLLVPSTNIKILSMACLAIGMVFVGTCNGDASSTIIQMVMELEQQSQEESLNSPMAKFMSLGLAFLYLGQKEQSETIIETLKIISHPIGKITSVLVNIMSWSASGNVLKIQELLQLISSESSSATASSSEMAVLGVAAIALGEDIGSEMCIRTLSHLVLSITYGQHIQHTVYVLYIHYIGAHV